MIPPRISNGGKLPCRIESTKIFSVRNLEYYYMDINIEGYVSFGQHKPDTGVCATTIDLRLLGYMDYIKKSKEFLEDMEVTDKVFYDTLLKFYKDKFNENLLEVFDDY